MSIKFVLQVSQKEIQILTRNIELFAKAVTVKKYDNNAPIQNQNHTSSGNKIHASHQQPKIDNIDLIQLSS